MSRYTRTSPDRRYEIAYGYDNVPFGGYFFTVYDQREISDTNEEGVVLSEGLMPGISSERMQELFSITEDEWGIKHDSRMEQHLESIKQNLPF